MLHLRSGCDPYCKHHPGSLSGAAATETSIRCGGVLHKSSKRCAVPAAVDPTLRLSAAPAATSLEPAQQKGTVRTATVDHTPHFLLLPAMSGLIVQSQIMIRQNQTPQSRSGRPDCSPHPGEERIHKQTRPNKTTSQN